MGAFKEQASSEEKKGETLAEWSDEGSQGAEKLLIRKGVRLPWGHGDDFGEEGFQITGLRAGGIGVVYFVESSGRDRKRRYAAKTLNSFLKPDYLDLSPLVQEKISQAFLEETMPWLEMGQHPHIVSVHLLKNIVHPELHRNIPFVFSDFIPGGNLKGYLNHRGRLTIRESLTLGIQLCDGLLHAYSHGLESHHDIKPENIMVYDDGLYQVTDFGANVVGTPGYMAPEQVVSLWRRRGKKIVPDPVAVDHRADQFAVGLVMLESILGRHPFPICRDAVKEWEQAERYVNEGVGEVADDTLNDALREILTHILSTEPDDRYSDLTSLRGELVEVLEEEYGSYAVPEIAVDDSAEWWYYRGEAYYTLGRPGLAAPPFEKALERYRRISGIGSDCAKCLMNLGMVYRETGRLPDAEKVTEEALSLFCRISGAELDQAACTMNLGIIRSYTGRFPEAEKAFQEALDIFRPIPGTELQIATCTLDMGTVYNSTGRFSEAERVYREAFRLFCSIPGTELEQARCLQNLGVTLSMTGHYRESEVEYKKALRIYRRIPGIEYEMGICTMNLGGVCYFDGRYREAEKFLNDALRIHQSIPGTEHEQARCIQNLGSTFYATGRYTEAEKMFKEALSMYRDISGAELDRADCTENWANILRDTGRYAEAEKAYQEALKVYRSHPGVELMQGRCTFELARCFQSMDELSRARDLAEESLILCEPFPPESTEIFRNGCRKILEEYEEKK
jgi:tetratricopeptide (TPR) repeat protein